MVKDIAPKYNFVKLEVLDVKKGKTEGPRFTLPKLEAGKKPVNSRAGFEEAETFPPPDWELSVLSGNICRPDEAAALTDSRGLLCQDLGSSQMTLIRAGLRFPLPIDGSPARPIPMSWRLGADIQPVELAMSKGQVIHPLAFLAGDDLVAAACLRKIGDHEYVAGVLIRSADGLFREQMEVTEGQISTDSPVKWELELLRLGTRQTTAVVRLNGHVVIRLNGDTTGVEPDIACVGILHRHSSLQITLHVDELRLTEAPR
jgi:hypothetical protein